MGFKNFRGMFAMRLLAFTVVIAMVLSSVMPNQTFANDDGQQYAAGYTQGSAEGSQHGDYGPEEETFGNEVNDEEIYVIEDYKEALQVTTGELGTILPVPFSAVYVSTWDELRTAVYAAVGGSVEIIVTDNIDIANASPQSSITILPNTEVTLLANNDWTILGPWGHAFRVEGTLNLGSGNPSAGQQGCLTFTGFNMSAIYVPGGIFNMYSGEITGNVFVGGVLVTQGGMFEMHGGRITGNSGQSGGGVQVQNAAFIMHDGEISGNEADSGGGVQVQDGTFIMYDGEISGNEANMGGGVFVGGDGAFAGTAVFSMWGGEISGNSADFHGGGVYLLDATFDMWDGRINDNIATAGYGGGVIIDANGILNMHDGEFNGNFALWGGGIATHGGQFTMYDGNITDNSAVLGGGIHDEFFSSFPFLSAIHGGEVSGNSAELGGGIYVSDNAIFTISNATISGNTAERGGGIFVDDMSTVEILNSSIIDNTALYEGGGIYTANFVDYDDITINDYQNLILHASVIFSGNSASQAYHPPAVAPLLTNIQFASSSRLTTNGNYIHPINNDDINFIGDEPILGIYPIGFIVAGETAFRNGSLSGQVLLGDAPESHVIGWVFSSFSGYIATAMVESGGHLTLSQIPEPIPHAGYEFLGWRPWVATTSPSETVYISPEGTLPRPIGSITGYAPGGTGNGPIGETLFTSEALTEFRNILGRGDEFITWSIIFIAHFAPIQDNGYNNGYDDNGSGYEDDNDEDDDYIPDTTTPGQPVDTTPPSTVTPNPQQPSIEVPAIYEPQVVVIEVPQTAIQIVEEPPSAVAVIVYQAASQPVAIEARVNPQTGDIGGIAGLIVLVLGLIVSVGGILLARRKFAGELS